MIHSSTQLKDKVKNFSHGNSRIAQNLIRSFVMERFLERVSLSPYKDRIVLKGGMLVASIVGIDLRATMDIDATFQALPLTIEDAKRIIEEIVSIPLDDGMTFEINKITNIMTDFEYPGIRLFLDANLDRLRQSIKIDISTDDVITPAAMTYKYPLFLENRSIDLLSYTIETILAEKIQTVLAREIYTTRMRDYYDIYELTSATDINIDHQLLKQAYSRTSEKRNTIYSADQIEQRLQKISRDDGLSNLWARYAKSNYYVRDLDWFSVRSNVIKFITELLIKQH